MALRVGFLGIAHLHVWSYLECLKQSDLAVGAWVYDEETERLISFSEKSGIPATNNPKDLIKRVDCVIITSENIHHRKLAIQALNAGIPVLCEKPLATSVADAEAIVAAAKDSNTLLMTAFPCRFTPSWKQVKEKVARGDIGKIVGIAATNRGQCPGDWFVETDLSGGGAMIDHTVHVADLLRDLLGESPTKVQAMVNNHHHNGATWEDSAMLTLDYPSGVFATLDSSWSRPRSFYTWGDVTMKIVGEEGVIELDMLISSPTATPKVTQASRSAPMPTRSCSKNSSPPFKKSAPPSLPVSTVSKQ